MAWDKDAKRKILQHQERLERVHRAAMFRLAFQTDIKSPVDTGRFRSNWIGSYGTIDKTTTTETGRDSVGEFNLYLKGSPISNNYLYYTNSLPYSQRLEYGWSAQAPNGVVRTTARNWSRYVKEANRLTK